MRGKKNKEVIIGLVIIIILSIIAIFLIVYREISQAQIQEQGQNQNLVLQYSNNIVKYENEQQKFTTNNNVKNNESYVGEEIAASKHTYDNMNSKQVMDKSEIEASRTVEIQKEIEIQDKYRKRTLIERKTRDHQLEELFEYWDQYKLEAVDDLIHLDRIIEISEELKGTDNYYYYGTVNKNGQPNGRGLAVYADNAYYCGDFMDGDRSGNGMWLQTYVYDENIPPENRVILEHSYNGEWKNDKPNGNGQEHYDYNYEMIPDGARYLNNVIGEFINGYYSGEMYLMIITNSGDTSDWYGNAQKGVWLPQEKANSNGEIPIWVAADVEQSYFWINPADNKGHGIIGFK